jgi:feruloyl esterase
MMLTLILSVLLSLPSLNPFVLGHNFNFQDRCRSFNPNLENSTVELVHFVPQKTVVSYPYRDATCGGPGQSSPVAQNLCRVALNIKTSNRSAIQFEAWLPEKWNGRFLATGNGGIGGCKFLLNLNPYSKYGDFMAPNL